MRAGGMTTRARFERKQVVGRDALNQDILDWRPYTSVWGRLVGVSGRQVHAGEEMHEPVTLEYFVRVGPPFQNLDRFIVLNGPLAGPTPVSIVDVLPTQDPGELRLQCVRGLRDD